MSETVADFIPRRQRGGLTVAGAWQGVEKGGQAPRRYSFQAIDFFSRREEIASLLSCVFASFVDQILQTTEDAKNHELMTN